MCVRERERDLSKGSGKVMAEVTFEEETSLITAQSLSHYATQHHK